MSLRQNINKIHGDVLSRFQEVSLDEKSDLKFGNYFQLECVNNDKKIVAIITKKNIETGVFNWGYYSNPDNKNHLVERSSTVDSFISDLEDIFEKNRFDSDYIK